MQRILISGWRLRMKLVAVSLAVAGVAAFVASGALATSSAPSKAAEPATSVVISTKVLPGLGTLLVNGAGRTLYIFVPDKRAKVTCLKGCAVAWPPVKLAAGAKAVAQGKAKAALLGSDPDAAGFRVVTYNHWPLYTWVGDTAPGKATGQALNVNGGLWYVISPSGVVIHTKVKAVAPSKPAANADGCPPGETIAEASPSGDNDADNTPGGPDDHDGCL